jgi:hypothetical protein
MILPRAKVVLGALDRHKPDVIALQEVSNEFEKFIIRQPFISSNFVRTSLCSDKSAFGYSRFLDPGFIDTPPDNPSKARYEHDIFGVSTVYKKKKEVEQSEELVDISTDKSTDDGSIILIKKSIIGEGTEASFAALPNNDRESFGKALVKVKLGLRDGQQASKLISVVPIDLTLTRLGYSCKSQQHITIRIHPITNLVSNSIFLHCRY